MAGPVINEPECASSLSPQSVVHGAAPQLALTLALNHALLCRGLGSREGVQWLFLKIPCLTAPQAALPETLRRLGCDKA